MFSEVVRFDTLEGFSVNFRAETYQTIDICDSDTDNLLILMLLKPDRIVEVF